ncbi:MAG TPA: hypothetical protein PKE45_09000 [Caldilineaceae bacterium]|nr:hypothetical protein [Caldilineaceae bacterium]
MFNVRRLTAGDLGLCIPFGGMQWVAGWPVRMRAKQPTVPKLPIS